MGPLSVFIIEDRERAAKFSIEVNPGAPPRIIVYGVGIRNHPVRQRKVAMVPSDQSAPGTFTSSGNRRRSLSGIVCLSVLLALVRGTVFADMIPLREIVPGMTGYGLTVFAGDKVDTFGVKVIGVQDKTRVAGSMILVEISGHDLANSGIAQGMSGSPIFLDGRLAGALALGWGGALRPLAGVTPAAEMLSLPTDPVDPVTATALLPPAPASLVPAGAGRGVIAALGWDVPPPTAESGRAWPDANDLLLDLLPELKTAGTGKGLPEGWVIRLPGEQAQSAGTGGSGPGTLRLVPGSSCAVPLIMGDALLGVIGTTTWVEGDDVFMMGHPFLQRGPVCWPLASAKVLTVLPSRQMSFKMAGIGSVVGSVYHDQRSGLTGRMGPGPRMVPVTATVRGGAGNRDYRFKVVDDPSLTPALVFWCLYNSLLVQGDDASQQTIRYRVVARWEGDPGLAAAPLELTGIAVGPGGAQGLAAAWMAPLAMLMNNSDRRVVLAGIEAEFMLDRPAAVAAITGLDAPGVLARGERSLTCTVHVQPRRGPGQTQTVTLPLPPYLPPGPYRLVAASAADLFALEIQRLGGAPPVDTLHDLVRLLRRPRSPDHLVVALVAPGGGVVVDGREMPNLPGSRMRLLESGDPTISRPLAELPARISLPLDWALHGSAVRNLTIEAGVGRYTARPRP